MPLKKFVPSKSNFISLGGIKVTHQPYIPTQGPILVPVTPQTPTPTPPPTGAFSSAFSNAFNI